MAKKKTETLTVKKRKYVRKVPYQKPVATTTATKARKYLSLISQTDEELKLEENILANETANYSLDGVILDAKKNIALLHKELRSRKAALDFKPKDVLNTQMKLDIARKELQYFNYMKTELF